MIKILILKKILLLGKMIMQRLTTYSFQAIKLEPLMETQLSKEGRKISKQIQKCLKKKVFYSRTGIRKLICTF
ncbi:hypothetical protein A1E_01275 [Rickettsia canadensis str. McKiel]|uniref:Uncharacterized protein n=1 Tax=Rickettsia canadensis (strain McKiel) TaxID=293613 RepID=A8EXW7_RICCK|nr:hypothetical protein A1E_01275 [Rickettsia canadensis str. McKiel]